MKNTYLIISSPLFFSVQLGPILTVSTAGVMFPLLWTVVTGHTQSFPPPAHCRKQQQHCKFEKKEKERLRQSCELVKHSEFSSQYVTRNLDRKQKIFFTVRDFKNSETHGLLPKEILLISSDA
jgi:hypothetical protein